MTEDRKRKQIRQLLLTFFAAAVVFVVTYALILPGITLDEDRAAAEPGIEVDEEGQRSIFAFLSGKGDGTGETDIALPAQEYVKELDELGLTVSVRADEGALPEGATMEAQPVQDAETAAYLQQEAEAQLEGEMGTFAALTIDFYDADSQKIDPLQPIDITITSDNFSEKEEYAVLQLTEDQEVTVIPQVSGENAVGANTGENNHAAIEQSNTASGEIVFKAEQSAIYTIAGTETITAPFTAGDGRTYEVTVTYDASAGIPAGSRLQVSEVTEDDGKYEDYVEQTAEAIDSPADRLEYIKLLDISIVDENGVEVELNGPVDVQIRLMDTETQAAVPHVVHFTEEKAEVLETDGNGEEVSFETEGFSVFAVAYTVDFHYEVNGKMYEFSIPGGGFASFYKIVEVLGISNTTNGAENQGENAVESDKNDAENAENDAISSDNSDGESVNLAGEVPGVNNQDATALTLDGVVVSDATREFVSDVEKIKFSSPSLVDVSKINSETTVGAIKESRGLEVQYSAELTEEQITEIDAQSVEAGDWALIAIRPFDTEESLTVTMKTGEVFTIKVTDARDPLGLNGQTFALLTNKVNSSNGTTTSHTIQASVETDKGNHRGYYLESLTIDKNNGQQYALNSYDGLEYVSTDAAAWTFEYNTDEEAYYVSHNGQYLYIDPNITSKSGSQDHSLNLVTDKNIADKGTLIKITTDGNGNYYFGNSKGTLIWDYGSGYWLSNPDDSNETDSKEDNAAIRLCLPENPTDGSPHKATMISVQDTQPGQRLVIYQRVLQSDNTYKYYAINGYGQLVEVYPSSDSVYWKGNQSVEWLMEDIGSGYYTLRNTETGAYLSPKDGQNPTIIHQGSDFTSNPAELSISLLGKGAAGNPYTSKISCWDYTNNVTEGLKVTLSGNTAALSAVPIDDAQQFYFASRDPIVTGQLTTVDTVNSTQKGIKMTMYDFSGQISGARMNYQTYAMGGDTWGQGRLQQGIMERTLFTDETGWYNGSYYVKGFPISTQTNRSYGLVFQDGPASGNNQYTIRSEKQANHLFIQSVYDATGYFHYSSFENFARFNESTGDFTVYDQIGTPACLNSDWNAAYQNRGNFMPYNDLDTSTNKSHTYNNQTVYGNWYQAGNSDPLSDSDPRKGERLYMMEGVHKTNSGYPEYNNDNNNRSYDNLDYFFGMIMEAKFMQGEDGLTDRGDPMRYEFNGDDDLYVYVDNVLLLDIGGVHDAFKGYIDFSTGDIEVYPATYQSPNMFLGQRTTIKRQYWEAGQFPNGETWDHNVYPYDCDKANEFFDGETFRDYSTHEFKMFYMERGAGASNLQIDFNLMVLTDSQFRVKKEMTETQSGGEILNEYADAAFYYEAWVKVGEADYVPVTRQYLNSLNTLEDKKPRYQDGTEVEWKTDSLTETKFVIRPGQTAVFPAVDDNVKWYVKEVEPDGEPDPSRMLDSYMVSNSDLDISDPTGRTANKDSISHRNIVTYRNRPDDDLVNELRILKKVNGTPYSSNDKFEYRILFESTSGKMVPYSEGPYYQLDREGKYVYFENGQRKTQTEPRIAEKTSVNGSINNILDGDTIIIKGLLEGTDFYVYERTDTSYENIAPDGTPVENKYVFEGTELTGAFNRKTDDPETYNFGHPTGHLFDAPGGMTGDDGMINAYHITAYEQQLAASGSILMGSDADVTVKNRPYHPSNVEVKKNWPEDSEGFHMSSDLNDAELTFTLQRYKLDTRHGTVNLTGILNNPPHTGADPVYHFIKDGQTIKTIAYTDLIRGSATSGTLAVTDLPIGEYDIWPDDYVVGYTISHSTVPAGKITVSEGEETDVTVTTNYVRQHGTLTIRKTLTGNYAAHPNDTFTYTVHGPEGVTFTSVKKVSDAVDGVITIPVSYNNNSELPSGNYIITESVVNSDTSGTGLSGNHTPSSQGVYVNGNQDNYADFTGDYAAPLVKVTLHVGHTDNSGFAQDKESVFYLPAGATVNVTTSVKLCPYYDNQWESGEGVYAYGSTNACSQGVMHAYHGSSTDWVTRTFTFTVPANVQSYDYYLKTKCNSASWTPTVISAIAQNSRSRMMARSARSSALLGDSGSTDDNEIYNSVTNDKLPALTDEQQAKSKFVIDDEWVMTVVLTKDGYTAYLGDDTTPVTSGEITTGTSFWDAVLSHGSIVSEDENGNPYYYYIAAFSETGVPTGMTPSFDLDPDNSGKTLMSWKDNQRALSVTNDLRGNLQVTKTVKLNGAIDSSHGGAALTFYVGMFEDAAATTAIEGTVKPVTVASGSATGTALYSNLILGDVYYVYETDAEGNKLAVNDTFNGYTVTANGGQSAPITLSPTVNVDVENNLDYGYLKVHKEVKYNGNTPATSEQRQVLAGTYTFKVYTDENCTQAVMDGSNEMTLTSVIENDGLGKDSAVVSLPAGTYWLKEILDDDSYVLPLGQNPQQIEITRNHTASSPKTVNVTNDYEFNEEDDNIALDIVKQFTGLTSDGQIPEGYKVVLSYTNGGHTYKVDLGNSSYITQEDHSTTPYVPGGVQVKVVKSDDGLTWTWHVYNIPKESTGFALHEESYEKTGYTHAAYIDGVKVDNPDQDQSISVEVPTAVLTEVTDKRITSESDLRTYYVGSDYVLLVSINPRGTLVISDKSLNFLQRSAIENAIKAGEVQGSFSTPVRFFSTEQHPASIKIDNKRTITVSTDDAGKQTVYLPPNSNSMATGFYVKYDNKPVYNNCSIENRYSETGVPLDFVKVDSTNMTTPLASAQFTLKQLDPDGRGTYLGGDNAVGRPSGETDDEGKASITAITSGYYEISETKLPAGYILVDDGKVYIKVEDGVIYRIIKTADDTGTADKDESLVKNWTVVGNNDDGFIRFSAARAAVADDPDTTDVDESKAAADATFIIGNTPGAALPNTGGLGTNLIYFLGLLLTSFAGTGILMKRRRRNAA